MKLPAEKLVDLDEVRPGWAVLDWSAGLDGTVAILLASRRPEPGMGAAMVIGDREIRYAVHLIAAWGTECTELPAGGELFDAVRALPDGRLLLFRWRWNPREAGNGCIVSRQGAEEGRFVLGDAIQHVLAAPDGSIWVGYGDEAYGKPRSGVQRLDQAGQLQTSLREKGIDCMHCYAMTMDARGTVHAVLYTGFDLVSLAMDGSFASLGEMTIKGVHTLAVRGDLALIDGGYDTRGELHLYDVRQGRSRGIQLVCAAGEPIRPEASYAVDGRLYIRGGSAIYAAEVPRLHADRVDWESKNG